MKLTNFFRAFLMFFKRKKVSSVFVVGCGHSGTSIMISLLDNHDQIHAIIGETSLFYRSKLEILSTLYQWTNLARTENKKIVVEKTPSHIYKIGRIFSLFPDARVIIMIRDGRDVACSLRERTGDFRKGIDKWIKDNSEGRKYWNDPRVIVVKLEELVVDTKGVLSEVFHFIGLEFEESVLNRQGKVDKRYYSNEVVKDKNLLVLGNTPHETHMNRRNWQINQGLFNDTTRWRTEMSEDELQLFNSVAGEHLKIYGYPYDDKSNAAADR